MSKKVVIGILGGIGSGKSTVAKAFEDIGCRVIDADAIAHETLNEPEISARLVSRWGSDVLDAKGMVNRERVAEHVFSSRQDLDFLNSLVHPLVLDRCEQLLCAHQCEPDTAGIILDMPLLIEVGWKKKCDFLIFVACPDAKRLDWMVKNAKIDVSQLKKRENFQISLDKKKQIAHYIVNNNSDKSDIAEQVAQIFSSIIGSW